MRTTIARALVLGATTVATFGLLGGSASASHLCENDVNVGPQSIGVDNPLEGATGIAYVCLNGVITCEFGGGVHTVVTSITPLQVTANPVLYPPCRPHP